MSALPLADELLVHLAASDRRAAAQHCAALIGSGMALEHLDRQRVGPGDETGRSAVGISRVVSGR